MPTTDTFNIAASADDQWVYKNSGYPPSSAMARETSTTDIWVERSPSELVNGLLKFNTSALPDNAVISDVVLRCYVLINANADSLSLTAGWYAWDGASASDYSASPETSALSGVPFSGITTSTDNNFTLTDTSGWPHVSRTSYTYLRLHVSQRASDATPSGSNLLTFASYDHTTLTEPRLLVTYTLGGGELIGMIPI